MSGIGNIANTGIKASMANMDTISNNIANVNTVGFKKSHVNFANIYTGGVSNSGNVPGSGVQVQSINQDFSLGNRQLTNRGLDFCLGNEGFFVQKNDSGQVSYTRAGNFDVDLNGYFVGISGRVQGYPASNGKIQSSGTLVDLQLSEAALPAKATSNPVINANLDASATVPANLFSANDPTSYNYRSDTTIYDSLGNSYDMSIYYVKASDNNWQAQVFVNNQSIGSGSLAFQTNGALSNASGLDALSWSPTSGAASPQNLNINFTNTTQYVEDSKVTTSQDGYPAGVPTGFNVDGDGNINVSYTNGQSQLQGQIAVATFRAPQGLIQTENMSWIASSESGSPILDPATNSGAFNANMLELSNVDLTEELISLMSAQHDFQANAQVTQTYNQILKTIENI